MMADGGAEGCKEQGDRLNGADRTLRPWVWQMRKVF